MTRTKSLRDEHGVIRQAQRTLPSDALRLALLECLAELEDNECHRRREFPKTRLHRVTGIKEPIYRADIDKTSGWRIHIQYQDGDLHLKDVISGSRHDDVIKVIKSKRGRYSK